MTPLSILPYSCGVPISRLDLLHGTYGRGERVAGLRVPFAAAIVVNACLRVLRACVAGAPPAAASGEAPPHRRCPGTDVRH
eukprot:4486648-Pyramimonas_sp.AAC.1